MSSRTFKIFADYHQFYIQDESADGDLSEAWTDEAVANLLAVVDGTVGVGTVRNMDVPVTIEILSNEPPLNLANWDRVNECSIEVKSGKLVIAGCTDYFPEAARIQITPGIYRVRVCYGQLKSISSDGLEGDDNYMLQLWPDIAILPAVIKANDS